MLNHISYIEAALDDPEHMTLDNYTNKVDKDVDNCVDIVENLWKSADNGSIVHNGIRTVILGKQMQASQVY